MNTRKVLTDNRGLTLVEILLAMTILAIIVVPLSHAFVTAARVNQDSRERLRITTAAQDIMEGLVADDLEDLAYSIAYPAGATEPSSGNVVHDGFHLIKRSLVKGSMEEVRCASIGSNGAVSGLKVASTTETDLEDQPCIESADGGLNYEFVPKDGGKYYFALQDVTVETNSPNLRTDVLIEVDGAAYRSGSAVVSGNSAQHNSTLLADIRGMDGNKDFLFEENAAMMLADLNAQNYTSYNLTDMYMEISVVLSKVNDGGEDKVRITYNCRMTAKANSAHTISDPITVTGASNEVRNIFLFYYPTYNGASGTVEPDTIEFTNNDLYDCNLYIIKQDNPDFSGFLESYENSYQCNVKITENDPTDKVHTSIRTNLDYNLYDIGHNPGAPEKMSFSQANYTYNGSAKDDDFWNQVTGNVGGGREEDRIYNVNVYVYEEGTIANGLSTGSISADKLLVTLNGTMQ